MQKDYLQTIKYLLAVLLGFIGGGIFVAIATRAVPKIMSGVMGHMRECMQECGCDCDSEMCQKMMGKPTSTAE
jgi:hypothetical protein